MQEKRIYVIPDTQQKEGVKNPLVPIARHIADVKPDEIIHLGDHWDFPSLSKYDKGKKSHRVLTYLKDVKAGNEAMSAFFSELNKNWRGNSGKVKKTYLWGNHGARRDRAIEYGPDELVDLIEAFPPDVSGWDFVRPFLTEYTTGGVTFCHYFQQPSSGYAISSASALLNKKHASCVAGHKQGFDYAEQTGAGGKTIQAIIAGSCYFHDEDYMKHNNHHWRGTLLLTVYKPGTFDFERFTLSRLDKKYGS